MGIGTGFPDARGASLGPADGVTPMAGTPDPQGGRLTRLVEENLSWLRGWIVARVKDPDLADDLCQEAFLRAFRKLSMLRDPDRFPAWLFKIAGNTLRDHLRREARRRKRITFVPDLEDVDRPVAPGDPLAKEEAAEKLLEAIRELPRKLRDPLLLRHSKDLSYREIARILGISENAVQVRVFRARRKLRELCEAPRESEE